MERNIKKRLVLFSFIISFIVISYPVIATTTPIYSDQDTYVRQSSPNTNYGTATNMEPGQDSASTYMEAYIRFPTSSIGTQIIDSATCYIYIYNHVLSDQLRLLIYDTCTAWSESTTTWNTNKPTCSHNYYNTPLWTTTPGNQPPHGYFQWDCTNSFITAYNNGRQPMFVALIPSRIGGGPDYIDIGSRENSNSVYRPVVSVTYHTPTTSTTSTSTTSTTTTTSTTSTTTTSPTTSISTTSTTTSTTTIVTSTTSTTTTSPTTSTSITSTTSTSTSTTTSSTTTTISNTCSWARISGKVFKNNDPVPYTLVESFINGLNFANNFTDAQGKYVLNLNNYPLNYNLTLQATVDGKKYNKTSNIICGITNTIDIYAMSSTPIYSFIPVIIYTKDAYGNYERVFGHGENVNINVVFRNPTQSCISGTFDVKILDEYGNLVSYLENGLNINLEPFSYYSKTYSYIIPSNLGWFKSSGYDFYGYKVNVSVTENCSSISNITQNRQCQIGNSERGYGLFIDENKEPKWIRKMTMVNIANQIKNLISEANDKNYLINGFNNVLNNVSNGYFNTVYFGPDYYSYGFFESHQPIPYSPLDLLQVSPNQWAPTGKDPDTHYSTPPKDLVDLTGGLSQARSTIRDLVNLAHQHATYVVAYTNPIVLYDPDSFSSNVDKFYALSLNNPFVAHDDITSQSYVRLINNAPKKVNFVECDISVCAPDVLPIGAIIGLPSCACPYPYNLNPLISCHVYQIYSNANHFLDEASACGKAKNGGSANNDYGFSPNVIANDLASGENWPSDPSYHYHIVKQFNWLKQNYNFDGILVDDIGRVIMNIDWSKVISDPGAYWRGEYATLPSSSRYGISENSDCNEIKQQTGSSDNSVVLDSVAGMLKHMRSQLKYYNPDSALIISDYFAPSSVGWNSIYGTTDMHNSDQFPLLYPEFAQYAYSNFMHDYKPVRTDLRRSLSFSDIYYKVPLVDKREAWLRGIYLAAAWANRANVEIIYDDFIRNDGGTKQERNENLVYTNYNKMYQQLDSNPIFMLFHQVGQDLLYHSSLPETQTKGNVQLIGWYQINPYYVLYKIPTNYGEFSRILHVINARNDNLSVSNSDIPRDYIFKIKMADGQKIESIYLISPDSRIINGNPHPDPDNNGIADDSYFVDITNNHNLWSVDGNSIKVTVPQVISYTIVYVKFKPIQDPSENLKYSPNTLEGFSLFFTTNMTQSQFFNQSIIVPVNTTLLDTSLYYPNGKLDLHFYDPNGRHIGFNYSTSNIDLIPNSNYFSDSGKEEIKINDPINGTWNFSVYANSIPPEYSSTGMPVVLRTFDEGNYLSDLKIDVPNQNLNLNELNYLSVSVNNMGNALAFDTSASFNSSGLHLYENQFNKDEILSENGVSFMIPVVPIKNGTVLLDYNLSYLDENLNPHYILGSVPINVVVKPKLYLWELCTINKKYSTSTGSCYVNVTNIGTDSALNVKIKNIFSHGIQNSSISDFLVDKILSSQSFIFNYNITLQNGQRNIIVFADYQNSNNEIFKDGYTLNLFVQEDNTPPTITIVSPTNNSVIRSGTWIGLNITDDDNVSNVYWSKSRYFFDDFSNGTSNWTPVTGTWTNENNEYSSSIESSDAQSYINSLMVSNTSIETKFKILNGTNGKEWIGIHARKTNTNDSYSTSGYLAYIRYNGEAGIYKAGYGDLITTNVLYKPTSFKTLKFVLSGNVLKVMLNEMEIVKTTDNTFTNGYVSLWSGWSSSTHAHFDDVKITDATILESPYNIDTTGWPNGLTNLDVFAYDEFGNGNHSLFAFTFDNTPPAITILSPNNNTDVNKTDYHKLNVLLNFTNNTILSWIGYSLNRTANKTITEPINMTGISDKWNNVTVFANDSSGNMGASETKYFFYCYADINHDKKVDMKDVGFAAKLFGCNCPMPCYYNTTAGIPNSYADLNDDCKIDMKDIGAISRLFGKNC